MGHRVTRLVMNREGGHVHAVGKIKILFNEWGKVHMSNNEERFNLSNKQKYSLQSAIW